MKNKSLLLLAAMSLLLISALAQAAANDVSEKARQTCSVCHGADGNSVSPNFPRLAGQQTPYLEAQLKAFRNHTRADADAQDYMWGWAAPLNNTMITALARYYATQRPLPGAPGDTEATAKGKEIYSNGIAAQGVPACVACHGKNGEGNQTIPRLAGQHASYIIKQIKVFHTELRPAAIAMQGIVKGLGPEDARVVAAYLQAK